MICSKDDSGDCCGLCSYNPIVVIATHQRKGITTINIELLKKQTFVPKIIIVCSLRDEFEYYKNLGVSVLLEPNNPLGRKWQCGVNLAFKMGADPLIILGSDDLLHPNYIKEGLQKLNSGYDFVGSTSWYNFETSTKKLFKCTYQGVNTDFPIGSGKIYSKSLLAKVRAKLFDPKSERRLDDQGHRMISGSSIYLNREPKILAIKGSWMVMNDTRKYVTSPNIKTEKASLDILNEYGYTR